MKPRTYDGQEFTNITVIRGGRGFVAPPPFIYDVTTVHPCQYLPVADRPIYEFNVTQYPENYYLPPFPYVCARTPTKRSFSANIMLDGRMYVFGGRDSSGNGNNDVWYRGKY